MYWPMEVRISLKRKPLIETNKGVEPKTVRPLFHFNMARPDGFEPPTTWFEASALSS